MTEVHHPPVWLHWISFQIVTQLKEYTISLAVCSSQLQLLIA